MDRRVLEGLLIFATVARAGSFTRAAPELGMSTSAVSYAIRRLESRLGARLLQRNSRSVSPSAAGQRFLETLVPALDDIDRALVELRNGQATVAGTVRVTATRQAYEAVLRPVLATFGERYPDAAIEVLIEYEFRDIIASRLDAGIRLGEKLEQDMIALPIGGPLRMTTVAAPAYLDMHDVPRIPEDLVCHRCVAYRMRPDGHPVPWEFERNGEAVDVRVSGPLTVNEPELALDAAIDGLAIAYVLEDLAAPHVANGNLIALLTDYAPAFPGFYLYYPSRRQLQPALAALIDLLRQRVPGLLPVPRTRT